MQIGLYSTFLDERKHNKLIADKMIDYNTSISLSSPDKIYQFMVDNFQLNIKAEEYLFMISFDSKCNPLGVFEISHGLVNASLVSPRELYIRGLLSGAVNIAIIHNHPSFDCTPSNEDLQITKRVKEAGDLIGIRLMDHLVIGGSNYYSLKEHGQL